MLHKVQVRPPARLRRCSLHQFLPRPIISKNSETHRGVIDVSDEQQIRATIQTYFDCMYDSSADKTHTAFHPNARITGYLEDGLHEMTVSDFADFVASQQPSAREKGEPARLEVLSLDIAGNTAVAKVRDDYLGMTFMDTLSFLKTDSGWSIYNKLFHVEGPSG